VPLHTWLLVPWIKVFGLTPTAVRAICFVYAGLAALLLWRAVRTSQLVTRPLLRAALVVVVLFDAAVSFSYRSGRYDALGMLLAAMAAATVAARPSAFRRACLVFIGILVPFTGLQLVPYAIVVSLASLAVFGPRTLRLSIPLGLGVAMGGVLLYATLLKLGTWHAFVLAVQGNRGNDYAGAGNVTKLLAYATTFCTDPLLLVVIVVLILGVALGGRLRGVNWRRFDVMALILVAAVPAMLILLGHFARFYLWMISIPGIVAAFQVCERFLHADARLRRLGWAAGALLVIGAMSGLPARLAVTAIEWSRRDYAPVEAFISRAVKADDVVFADWQAFYALARVKAKVYYPAYRMNPHEKATLTKLVASPEEFGKIATTLGGSWHEVCALHSAPYGLGARLYNLSIYARGSGD
jgi:hypothetical protein